METEDAAARMRRGLDRRKAERYLDRPSLVGMLALVALPGGLLAVLIHKIAIASSSAVGLWIPGFAIGAAAAAAAVSGTVLQFRALVRASRRRHALTLPGVPGASRPRESGWRGAEPLLFAGVVIPSFACLGAVGYLLGGRVQPGIAHPKTMFQLIALGYATIYLATGTAGLAWFTARPYTGLGLRRWRLALRGHCPGPVRVVVRPAGQYDSQECEPCYLPVCDCMWSGHARPLSEPNAAELALAEARRHSPNAHLDPE